jgi:hypothetical protein
MGVLVILCRPQYQFQGFQASTRFDYDSFFFSLPAKEKEKNKEARRGFGFQLGQKSN